MFEKQLLLFSALCVFPTLFSMQKNNALNNFNNAMEHIIHQTQVMNAKLATIPPLFEQLETEKQYSKDALVERFPETTYPKFCGIFDAFNEIKKEYEILEKLRKKTIGSLLWQIRNRSLPQDLKIACQEINKQIRSCKPEFENFTNNYRWIFLFHFFEYCYPRLTTLDTSKVGTSECPFSLKTLIFYQWVKDSYQILSSSVPGDWSTYIGEYYDDDFDVTLRAVEQASK